MFPALTFFADVSFKKGNSNNETEDDEMILDSERTMYFEIYFDTSTKNKMRRRLWRFNLGGLVEQWFYWEGSWVQLASIEKFGGRKIRGFCEFVHLTTVFLS